MMKSKLHRARVTDANLYYEGSLTVDAELMSAADLLDYERVQVVNVNNGARLETYLIPGEPGSGVICLNGAAARLGHKGDQIIIISYAMMTREEAKDFKPRVVLLNERNHITHTLDG